MVLYLEIVREGIWSHIRESSGCRASWGLADTSEGLWPGSDTRCTTGKVPGEQVARPRRLAARCLQLRASERTLRLRWVRKRGLEGETKNTCEKYWGSTLSNT